MRVVHVYKDVYPVKGGIEDYILPVCAHLRRDHGIDARILVTSTTRRTEKTEIDGVPVVKAGRIATVKSAPIGPMLPALLRELKADIVHLSAPYPIGELAYLAVARNTPMVMTYHSDIVRQKTLGRLYGPFFEAVLRRAYAILATSPQYAASSPWLRRHRKHVRVLTSGIILEPYLHPTDSNVRLAKQLRQQLGSRVLYSHGVFRYYKGLHYLIEAMPSIPNTTLLLTGRGPEEAALREQVTKLGLDHRVVFAGPVGDDVLPAYYLASDVYVLPAIARSEALGLSMVQAQASGLPCLSTEIGTGTSYVNLEGETGLVVPPQDAHALARAAVQLLGDCDLRSRFGLRAREHAHVFDLVEITAQIATLYREIAATCAVHNTA